MMGTDHRTAVSEKAVSPIHHPRRCDGR